MSVSEPRHTNRVSVFSDMKKLSGTGNTGQCSRTRSLARPTWMLTSTQHVPHDHRHSTGKLDAVQWTPVCPLLTLYTPIRYRRTPLQADKLVDWFASNKCLVPSSWRCGYLNDTVKIGSHQVFVCALRSGRYDSFDPSLFLLH